MAVGGREDGDAVDDVLSEEPVRVPGHGSRTSAAHPSTSTRSTPPSVWSAVSPEARIRAGRSGTLEQAAQEAQLEVREPERRRRQRVGEDVGTGDLHVDAVSGGVLGRRADGQRVEIERLKRPEPEPDGGDREDAGAAAEVERGRRLEPAEQLERGPGRAVGARPERAAGIDHDGDLLGLEPRRADPQLPHPDGPVKRPPGVLPAWGDGLGLEVGRGRGFGVPCEDDIRSVALLLHAGREELEHPRQRDLGVVGGDAQAVAVHRKAARRRPRKLSSGA